MIIKFEGDKEDIESLQASLPALGIPDVQVENVIQARKSSISHETVDFLTVIISVTSSVALNLLSSYLYDILKLHSPKVKLRVGDRDIMANSPEEISEALMQEQSKE